MKEKTMNIKRHNAKQAILTSVLAMVVSLVLGAILLAICGYSPIESYIAIFGSSLGTVKGFALSLSQATPLLFTGMAFAIAYRVRMINTGAEGQLYVGAMAAALSTKVKKSMSWWAPQSLRSTSPGLGVTDTS